MSFANPYLVPADTQAPPTLDPNIELIEYVAELGRRFDLGGRVLLVQSFQFLLETINLEIIRNRGYYAYPPTGLQWLARTLLARGVEVEIFDLNYEFLRRVGQDPDFDPRDWLGLLDEALERFKPSLIGVTSLTVYTDLFTSGHPLTILLQHLAERGQHLVMVGGPTVSNEIKGYLSRGLCHLVIEGEGEDRLDYLYDLFQGRGQGHPPRPGIHFRRDNRIHSSQGEAAPVRLASSLRATYDLVPVERYCQVGCLNPYSRMAGRDTPYAAFQLNRGCRGNCRFCGVRAFMGQGVRTHPVEELAAEMDYLVRERGVRHLEALDDDFLADPAAARQFLTALVGLRQEFGITWSANNGMMAASLDRTILGLMRDSGCLGFKIGFESGNPEMLRRIRKPGTLATFHALGQRLQDFPELFVGGNYIIGLLGEETFAQIMDTFRLSVRLNLDWSSFTTFQVTNRPLAVNENLKTDTTAASDFIPAKDRVDRVVDAGEEDLIGPEIFNLAPDKVPTREQIRAIWFAFNLVGNYINNKNLRPGGRPDQLAAWLEALLITYPQNPYMHLFASLAQGLCGRRARQAELLAGCRSILVGSESWRERFARFGLPALMEPWSEPGEIRARLDQLMAPYRACLGDQA